MLKGLLCRFRQGLRQFNMLLVKMASETSIFRRLPNHVFRSPYFPNYITYEGVIFFFKMFKIWSRFQKCTTKLRKILFLLYEWIWIGCLKLSLLKSVFLPSAVSVSTNSPNILHITKKDLFQLNLIHIDY